MQPTTTSPSYIPLRTSGWPTRRAPRWAIASLAALLAVGVAVGLSHRPTAGQRGADLRGLLQTIKTDTQSCAGGVRESLVVLRSIDAGASHDLATALGVATLGATNCSPANNELLADFTSVQVPESLSSYHLQSALMGLIDWAAPDAQRVMTDVATVLADRGKPAEAADRAALRLALRKLDAQRSAIYALLTPAIKALSPQSALPVLPG
ncbi:MAG TPA: hypothetical protein VNF47_26115 [Streptosporangiaceae bacterium]|nr:hypothetical protein [Streptosporangiaceae bacterium]